ncbi:MAG: 50S ribosomal protein L11 methyltransferase [Bacteroidales bacterium]
MAYLEFEIPVRSLSREQREIVMSKMSMIGFDGFAEGEHFILAYIEDSRYSGSRVNDLTDELEVMGIRFKYHYHQIEDQNWNETWESKFQPILIDGKVLIRAPFHDSSQDIPCTLIIEPKMSFGTGHHFTTRLMVREMLKYPLEGKQVLDMGCGTGVLAILASKSGASRVVGVDYDQWAYENALENVERNETSSVEIRLGEVDVIGKEEFDLILANITRNVLVKDMSVYEQHLSRNGTLIVSGFLAEDVQHVLNAGYQCGISHLNTVEDNNWICLTFKKP